MKYTTTSCSLERDFSKVTDMMPKKRNRLHYETIEVLMQNGPHALDFKEEMERLVSTEINIEN